MKEKDYGNKRKKATLEIHFMEAQKIKPRFCKADPMPPKYIVSKKESLYDFRA